VVMAILAIADTYGLDVVAEGIESPSQAEVLKQLGCQHGQGYHFARPMPAQQFTELLQRRRSTVGVDVGGPALALGRVGEAGARPANA